MYRCLLGLVFMFALLGAARGSDDTPAPIAIVDARMQAFNNHDIRSFLDLYADDVEIYTYPDRLLTSGKAGLQSIFEPLFEEALVSVTIHSQIPKDSYVINHETVNYGDDIIEYVSVYEVRNGLIRSVRFVRD